jgi:hypothetical protein
MPLSRKAGLGVAAASEGWRARGRRNEEKGKEREDKDGGLVMHQGNNLCKI